MRSFRVTTRSGSVYVVEGDGTRFRCRKPEHQEKSHGGNVPIERPYALHNVLPWPPEEGVPLVMITEHFLDKGHPDRMPGGGKITSPVTKVQELLS